jgi:hypothetical protein
MAECTNLGKAILRTVAERGILDRIEAGEAEAILDECEVTDEAERAWFLACVENEGIGNALSDLWIAYDAGREAGDIPEPAAPWQP